MVRRCSECPAQLPEAMRAHAKTCGQRCRMARARRLQAEAPRDSDPLPREPYGRADRWRSHWSRKDLFDLCTLDEGEVTA